MWPRNHSTRLLVAAKWAVILLLAKVFLAILAEYPWYFPADFKHSAFLSGRRHSFHGIYCVAFYVHILCGPVVILLSAFSIVSGARSRFGYLHRLVGKLLVGLVLALLTPTGLLMALHAYAGPMAASGFMALSLLTATAVLMAARAARNRRFHSHQRWAERSFLLLVSPLILRFLSGAAIVFQVESDWTYRLNAWLSWFGPLIFYEAWCRVTTRQTDRSHSRPAHGI